MNRQPPDNQPPTGAPEGDERYLWDGSGAPDEGVQRLERQLSVLKAGGPGSMPEARRFTPQIAMSAAAAGVLLAFAVWLLWPAPAPVQVALGPWRLVQSSGVRIGDGSVMPQYPSKWVRRVENAGKSAVEIGTDQGVRMMLQRGAVVDLPGNGVEPMASIVAGKMEVAAEAGDCWIYIDGRALSVGPPSKIVVERTAMKSAEVQVVSGWIDLTGWTEQTKAAALPLRLTAGNPVDLADVEFAPLMMTNTSPQLAKATEAYIAAISSKTDQKQQWNALAGLLNSAEPESAPMLWNLAWRAPEHDRERIFVRLDELLPAKLASTRGARVKLEPEAMNELWLAIVAHAERAKSGAK